MPPTTRTDQVKERYPYPAYNFHVSVTNVDSGDTVSGSFSEVSGLQIEVTPIEYRDGMDDTTVRKIRGLKKFQPITLKRGVTGHVGFFQWLKRGMDGDADRQQGYIALLDEDRNEVMRWNFSRAWPTKYTAPTFNAKNNEIGIETVELSVENLELRSVNLLTLPRYDVQATVRPAAAEPLRTDIAAIAGSTSRGPVGVLTRVQGIREYEAVFGTTAGESLTGWAARGYFANGGQVLNVVRLASVDARPARGGLELDGQLTGLSLEASSPGRWADAAQVVVRRRRLAGASPVWGWRVELADQQYDALSEGPPSSWHSSRLVALPSTQELEETIPDRSDDPVVEWAARLEEGRDGDAPAFDVYQRALERVEAEDEIALVSLPEVWMLEDDAPVALGIAAAMAAAASDRMVIGGLPHGGSAVAVAALADLRVRLVGPAASAFAAYHPWICVLDETDLRRPRLRAVPPVGHVLGVISRLDRERGPARTPANGDFEDIIALDHHLDDQQANELAAAGVNLIACVPGRGLQVWGGRTLSTDAGVFIAHRRLVHRLVRAIRRVAVTLAFDNNQPALRLALKRAATTVLLEAYRSQALVGSSPAEAFEVRCDATTTSEADVDAGRVVCMATFALGDPIEVIAVHLSLDREGRVEVVER